MKRAFWFSSWIPTVAIAGCLVWPTGHVQAGSSARLLPTLTMFAESTASTKSATISGTNWVDTGMDVNAGDKLHITAQGTVNMGKDTSITAEGQARGWVDTLRALMVPSAGRGALVGRIGNSNAATPFFVGADGTVQAPIDGRLYLAINQDKTQSPDGKYEVKIDRIAASAATANAAAASASYNFKPLFAELDQKLPYRVSDAASGGNPGDLVNFVIVGSRTK